jgi:hypothetical protein
VNEMERGRNKALKKELEVIDKNVFKGFEEKK